VAIDISAPRAEELRLPLGLARISAIPARLVLTGVVAASFLTRFLVSLAHATPRYFPDEYIYASIARSLAEHGRPVIRGAPAHFPALLEPLAAAPFWLFHDPALAYRLTQAENALAMSLAAVPVYLLTRRIGLGTGLALAAAALAVASPDLLFGSYVLAEPLAYPLVLTTLYAAVCALSRPSRRAQGAFVALAAMTALTRIQYALLPIVFVAGAIAVERGSIRRALGNFRFTWGIFVAPLAALIVLGPGRILGTYNAVADFHIRAGSIVHWVATDSMLLVYCAGWVVLVPGALIGFAYALGRPSSREEAAFGGIAAGLLLILFAETSMFASNVAPMFQERYFMGVLPLVLPCFGLYLKRGRPARLATCLLAVGLLGASARIPLAPYSTASNKQDSPFLLGFFRLEQALGVANGSLLVAAVAALLSALAAAIAWRARLAVLAFAFSLTLAAAASAGSISFDRQTARSVRTTFLPADASWIDHSGLHHVNLIQTPGTLGARSFEQLFWNRSIDDVLYFGPASPIDSFGNQRVKTARDGRLVSEGEIVRAPLLISNYAVRMRLRGAKLVGRRRGFELWRPTGTPRVALFVGGLYYDRWLAQAGLVEIWPVRGAHVRGSLRLDLSLPQGKQRTVLTLRAPHIRRQVAVMPGRRITVVLPVSGLGPWTLVFRTNRPAYLSDFRTVSVHAETPVFTPA
jgi:hypothetical protein